MSLSHKTRLAVMSLFLIASSAHADVTAKVISRVCDIKHSLRMMSRSQCISNAKSNAKGYGEWLAAFNKNYETIRTFSARKEYALKELEKLETQIESNLSLLASLPIDSDLNSALDEIGLAKEKIENNQQTEFRKHLSKASLEISRFQKELK